MTDDEARIAEALAKATAKDVYALPDDMMPVLKPEQTCPTCTAVARVLATELVKLSALVHASAEPLDASPASARRAKRKKRGT